MKTNCSKVKLVPLSWYGFLHFISVTFIPRLKTAFTAIGLALNVIYSASAQPIRAGVEAEFAKSNPGMTSFSWTIGWSKSVRTSEWENLMLDGQVSHSLNKRVALLGGLGVHQTWETQDANLFELRPWQGITARFPEWKTIYVAHRLLAEERWQQEHNDWQFSPRARYRISTKVDITNSNNWLRSFYLFVAGEWLNNFNKPLDERFSSNQTYSFAIGFSPSESSVLELTYDTDVADNLREGIVDVDVSVITVRWLQKW